jgi:hypothetical protein
MKKIYLFFTLGLLFSLKIAAQPAGWSYSMPFQITNNVSTLVTDYQAQIIVNTSTLIGAGQMLANGDDIRFGKDCAGNTLYNFWIESGMNTASTVIWVKIDTLQPSATRTFYMYYGNSSAVTTSAIPGVFNGPMSSTDSISNGGAGGVGNSQRGFRFSANEDVLVTAFGKREPTGTTRYITLFNFATQAIVAQTQVGGPAAQWAYGNLASPIWLTQGTQYLLELYQGASDGYYFGTSSQIGQQLTYYDMKYCNSCTQNTFPTNTLTNYHYGTPDLWYWTKNNITPAPTVSAGTALSYNAGLDQAICFGDSVLVGASAIGGTGPYAYSWSPSTGISSPTSGTTYANPGSTNSYTITVTDNTGCVTTDNLTITVNPLPIIAATAVNDSICPGGSASMYVTGSSSSYLWQPGAITTMTWTASPSATTTYTVVGTDVNGCTNSTTQTLTVTTPPVVTVTGNYSSACDNAVSPLTLTANGAATYDWNAGAGTGTTYTDTPAASQTYTVIGTDSFGCSDTATYGVTLIPHPVASAAATNDSICSGTCITVTGTATGGSAPYTYAWVPVNVTTPSFTVCPTTTTCYTLTINDANGCSDAILYCVNVNPQPTIVTTGASAICMGDSTTLFATGSNIASINWYPASSLSPSTGYVVGASPSVTTTYTVVATSSLGCSDSTTQTLTVNPLPTVTYTSTLNTVCLNDGPPTLTGGSPAGGTYSGPGVSGTTFMPMSAGTGTHTITYTYSDANGCSASATHTIVVNPCTGIIEGANADGISVYPNPFSTILTIARNSTGDVTVNIFDSEGRLVMSKQTSGAKIEIETAELANGIYSLQLVDETGTKNFRVAK